MNASRGSAAAGNRVLPKVHRSGIAELRDRQFYASNSSRASAQRRSRIKFTLKWSSKLVIFSIVMEGLCGRRNHWHENASRTDVRWRGIPRKAIRWQTEEPLLDPSNEEPVHSRPEVLISKEIAEGAAQDLNSSWAHIT